MLAIGKAIITKMLHYKKVESELKSVKNTTLVGNNYCL